MGARPLQFSAVQRDFVTLVETHGFAWAKELFSAWTERERWQILQWAPSLADLCSVMQRTKRSACAAFAKWLVEREVSLALERCGHAIGQRSTWLELDAHKEHAGHLAHVLAAAVAISEGESIEQVNAFLLRDDSKVPMAFLVQVLRARFAHSAALHAQVRGSLLHKRCGPTRSGRSVGAARCRRFGQSHSR